jgi:hypothetical protein
MLLGGISTLRRLSFGNPLARGHPPATGGRTAHVESVACVWWCQSADRSVSGYGGYQEDQK